MQNCLTALYEIQMSQRSRMNPASIDAAIIMGNTRKSPENYNIIQSIDRDRNYAPSSSTTPLYQGRDSSLLRTQPLALRNSSSTGYVPLAGKSNSTSAYSTQQAMLGYFIDQ